MKKIISQMNFKNLFFLFFLFSITSQVFSQATIQSGEIIPFETRARETVRGDMAVIGNSILGLQGSFDGDTFTRNQPYNGGLRNGENGAYTREYHDIDNDPTFINNPSLFSSSFANNRNNYEYGGILDANGVPQTGSNMGTFSSSGANLNIDAACGEVKSAFLYWGGIYRGERLNNGVIEQQRTRFCGSNCEDYTEIKILPPGADQYYDISINPLSTSNPNGIQLETVVVVDGLENAFYNNTITRNPAVGNEGGRLKDFYYICRADVTGLFTNLQDNDEAVAGFWTVGNVRASTGQRAAGAVEGRGLAAGWTLAVIYEDQRPGITEKLISFFDGFSLISNKDDPVNFSSPPFETIPVGPVKSWLASASIEGDRTLRQDQFLIETETSKLNPRPGTAEANEPPRSAMPLNEVDVVGDNTNNFFNSTITDLGGDYFKVPNSSNTLGYDTDHFPIDNRDNLILNNGQAAAGGLTDTSATFYLNTTGDSYANFFNAFAIEVIAPDLIVEKRVFNESNVELTNRSTVDFNETLTYKLVIRNDGNDVAQNIQITDFLPVNTVGFDVSTVSVSDPSIVITPPTNETIIDPITGITYTTDVLRFTIPDITPTGECDPSDPNCREVITVEFDVQIISECEVTRNSCIDRIANVALSRFQGEINTNVRDQVESFFRFPAGCLMLDQGPTIVLANQIGQCESERDVICDNSTTLISAEGFEQYEWYRIPFSAFAQDGMGNPILDTNGNGEPDDTDFSITDGLLVATQLTSSNPNANQINVDRDDDGVYLVVQTGPPVCSAGEQSFVVTAFDPLSDDLNPLKDPDGTPVLDGTLLPSCSINPDLEIVQFTSCPTNGSPAEITIDAGNFAQGTNLVWSQFVEGSCNRTDNDCPFVGPTCAYQELKNSNVDKLSGLAIEQETTTFTVTETGSYRIVATTADLCVATYYFNAILINQTIGQNPPAANSCANSEILQITGLPDPNSTDALLYDLELFLNTDNTSFPTTPNVTQDPTDAAITASNYGRFTIPRSTSGVPNTLYRVVATPRFTGSTAATVSAIPNCPENLEGSVTFNDLNIAEFRFSRIPTCDVNEPITPEDDTKADIFVRTERGSAQYIYQLINDDTNSEVLQFGPTLNIQHTFPDVDPGINYKVRVFSANESVTLVADPLSTDNFCIAEAGPIFTAPVTNIVPELRIEKVVSCSPGQLRVTLTAPAATSPVDFTNIEFEIFGINNSVNPITRDRIVSGRGQNNLFTIDDISNEPPSDDLTPVPDGLLFLDLENITDFEVTVVSNADCGSPEILPNSLMPYVGFVANTASQQNIVCNGSNTGAFTVNVLDDNGVIFDSPHTGATQLEFDIISAPTGTPADVLDPQADGVYSNLPAGDYTIRITDVTDTTDPCFDEVEITITTPDPITAPTITRVQDYLCDPVQTATIRVENPTADYGGTTPYTFVLIDTQGTVDTADDVQVDTRLSTSYTDFSGLTDGNYVVQIDDGSSLSCTSDFSNQIDITPLFTVSFDPVIIPRFACDGSGILASTVRVDIDATTNNGGVIEGYRIIEIDGVAVGSPAPFTDNITGEFDLEAKDYLIEASTTAKNCTNTVFVEVEEFLPIQVQLSGSPENVACFGEDNGSVGVIVSRFDTTDGYNFELEQTSGTGFTTQTSTTALTVTNPPRFTGLPAGSYTLTVFDNTGTTPSNCPAEVMFSISQPDNLPEADISESSYDCENDTFSYVVSNARGGSGSGYRFQLDDPATTGVIEYPFQTTNTFSNIPNTNVTYVFTVRDGVTRSNCETTQNVIIDPNEELIVNLDNTASNFCIDATTATDASLVFNITSFEGTVRYRVNGSSTLETVVNPNNPLIIPVDSAGDFDIEFIDEVNDIAACSPSFTIPIFNTITTTTPNSPTLSCDASTGVLPTSGDFVSFDVMGGSGNYDFSLQNITSSTAVSAITDSDATDDGFRFDFDNSFDGDTIEITIEDTDGMGCSDLVFTFVVEYPSQPVITDVTEGAVPCNGDTFTAIVDPDGPESNFRYSFDGGTNFQNNPSAVLQAGMYDVVIENVTTQCHSTVFQIEITEPDIIAVDNTTIVRMPETCNGAGVVTPGSLTFDIIGGTGPDFVFELFDDNGDPVAIQNTTGTRTASFPSLGEGDYSVRISEDVSVGGTTNTCAISVPFNIPNEPQVQLQTTFSAGNCMEGVTLFFEVIGGADPDLFEIAPGLDPSIAVNPSLPGDNVFRFGDALFPSGGLVPADPARYFAITGLDFNTTVTALVFDRNSGCVSTSLPETTPSSTSSSPVITAADASPTGTCSINSGFVEVTFTVDTGSLNETFEVDIIRTSDDTMVIPSITIPSAQAINNPSTNSDLNITGLPLGNYRVRVKQVTGSPSTIECNDSENFSIGRAEPLEGPFLVGNEIPANCDRPAEFSVRAEEGLAPYNYALSRIGTADDPTPTSSFPFANGTPITIDVANTTLYTPVTPSGSDPVNLVGRVEVWVRDANGCVEGPLVVDVLEDKTPELTLADFSPEQCNLTGNFTIGFTIDNYFTFQEPYTIEVNGITANVTFDPPSTPNQRTGIITVTDRNSYNVTVVGNIHPTCDTSDSFRIPTLPLSVDVELEDPDCNADIPSIEATVRGGFATAPNRSLTYTLSGGGNDATITTTDLSFEFVDGVTYDVGTNVVNLVATEPATVYTIAVRDVFDSTASTPRFCETSDDDQKAPVRLPVFAAPTLGNLNCITDNNGTIQLNIDTGITSDTPPLTYQLYEFDDPDGTGGISAAMVAQDAIDNDTVISSGSLVTTVNGSDETLFESLVDDTRAAYVAVLTATTLNCELTSTVITLSAPNQLSSTDFEIANIVQGICNDTDTTNDNAVVTIRVLNEINGSDTRYEYSIPGGSSNVAVPSTPNSTFDITLTPNNSTTTTVNISIVDRFTNCPAVMIPIMLDVCELPRNPLPLSANDTDIDCFDETDGTISFSVQPANGNPLRFTYTLEGGNPLTTRTSTAEITSTATITENNLPPGNYTLTVIDQETTVPTVNNTLVINRPTSLPAIQRPIITDYDCVTNTVTIEIDPVIDSGTGSYRFQIDDPLVPGGPFENTTGVFTNIPAPTVGTTTPITYDINIIDDKMCANPSTFNVDPQIQLDATVDPIDVCLPNDSDTSSVEIQVDITSGTPPFRWARVIAGSGAPAESAFTLLPVTDVAFTDTTINTANDYEYYIRDRFNCEVIRMQTILSPLSSTTPVLVQSVCIDQNLNTANRSDATYDVTISGGSSSYTFELAQGDTEATLGAFQTYTLGFPFNVNVADDGDFFQFRITDQTTGCQLVLDPFSFDFPDSPTANGNDVSVFCVGETGTVTLENVTGEAPFIYEYFESGETTPLSVPSQNTFTGSVGSYDYIVRDANMCEVRGSFAINDLSVNIQGNPVVRDVRCESGTVSNNNGEITINVVGGTPNYDIRLFDSTNNEDGTQLAITNTPPFPINFTGLTADIYRIEITDANNCSPVVINDIRVNSITDFNLGSPIFEEDCIVGGDGVLLLFNITGTPGPFEILSLEASTIAGSDVFVDPSAVNGDDVSAFGDGDFPAAFNTLVSALPAAVQNTYYAITGLDFDTAYTIKAADIGSGGCIQDREYTTPENDDVAITMIDTTPASNCPSGPNDPGSVDIEFERLIGINTDYDVVLLDPDNFNQEIPGTMQDITVNGAGLGSVNYPNLPVGRYIVSVTLDGTSCGDNEAFEIQQALPLSAPVVTSPLLIDCTTANIAAFPVQLRTENGIPDYTFVILPASAPAPASPLVGTISNDGIATVNIDATTEDNFIVYLGDNSDCPILSTPFSIDRRTTLPDLQIDPIFSKDQCEDVSVYRFDVSITNYDRTTAPYEFTIDGIDVTPNSFTPPTGGGTIATAELEVSGTGTFDVQVTNSNGCSSPIPNTITIFEPVEIDATIGDIVDCDGNIDEISVTVNGGFVDGARTLTYELIDAATNTPINTAPITQNIAAATSPVTFTILSSDPAVPQLEDDTNYIVRVTDDYGLVSNPNCSDDSDVVRQDSFTPSSLNLATVNQPSCNTTIQPSDASIRLNPGTIGDTPTVFGLVFFGTDQLAANNAVTNNDPTSGVSQIANGSDPLLFDGNLQPGFYVDFVFNTAIIAGGCPTAGTVYEIVNPPIFNGNNITVSAIQPTCDPVQAAQLRFFVTDFNDGQAPYFYRINPTDAFQIIPGTDQPFAGPITFNLDVTAGQTYDIELKDDGDISCGTITPANSPITINSTLVPSATIVADMDYTCTTNEGITITASSVVSGDSYRFEAITVPSGVTIAPNIEVAAATAVSVFTDLTAPGNYMFRITHLGNDPVDTSDDTGCSFDINHIVEDVEQIIARPIFGMPLDCEGDETNINFEVEDFSGFFRYTISDASGIVEEAIIEANTAGAGTAIVASAGNSSFDSGTGITTVTSGGTYGLGDYNIAIVGVFDNILPVTATSGANTRCMAMLTARVAAPNTPVSFASSSSTPLTCANAPTITIAATGGTPPYTYTLLEGTTPVPGGTITSVGQAFFGMDLNLASSLTAGTAGSITYTVDVVDSKGCPQLPAVPVTRDFVFNSPSFHTIEPIANIMVDCPLDQASVTIDVSSNTGTAPLNTFVFSFVETDGSGTVIGAPIVVNQTTLDFNNIQAGVFGSPKFYRVDAIDAFGCPTSSNEFSVVEPEPLDLFIVQEQRVTCDTTTFPDSSTSEFAILELTTIGGTGTIGFEVSDNPFDDTVADVNNSANLLGVVGNVARYEVKAGTRVYFRTFDTNNCDELASFTTNAAPSDVNFNITFPTEMLCPEVLGFVDIDGPVTGGEGNYVYELVAVQGATEISLPSTTPPFDTVDQLSDTRFVGLPRGNYRYRVSSGNCMVVPPQIEFEILQFDQLDYTSTTTRVSCAGEEDATVTVTLDSGIIEGQYSVLLIKEDSFTRSDTEFDDGIANGNFDLNIALSGVIDVPAVIPAVNEITFDNLGEGDYSVIVNPPNGCNNVQRIVTIETQDPLAVTFVNEDAPSCEGDAPGSIVYEITGGTAPYYYYVADITAGDALPDADMIFGKQMRVINQPAPVQVRIDTQNNGDSFLNNNEYQVFFVDSGNSDVASVLSTTVPGDLDATSEFNACEEEADVFSFITPILDGFNVSTTFNCPFEDEIGTGFPASYEIVVNGLDDRLVESRVTYQLTGTVSDNDTDPTNDIIVSESQSDPRFIGILPGNYEVALAYVLEDGVTVCNTLMPEEVNLATYTPLEFTFDNDSDIQNLVKDLEGNDILAPFFTTDELNRFVVRPINGRPFINDTGNPFYEYEITFFDRSTVVTSNQTGEFEIEESGIYQILVRDSTDCELTIIVNIEFIDIDVPNVFFPDGGDLSQSTWYPDRIIFDLNDDGNIDQLEQFKDIEVKVFDRYGRLIVEFKGLLDRRLGEGWDGTYQGERLPSGDYWYIINLNDERNREFTGHFTLYRK